MICGRVVVMVFAKSIEIVKRYDENNLKVGDFSCMNLIDGRNIWVHYEESMGKLVSDYV